MDTLVINPPKILLARIFDLDGNDFCQGRAR
jgi:hypothetical protein